MFLKSEFLRKNVLITFSENRKKHSSEKKLLFPPQKIKQFPSKNKTFLWFFFWKIILQNIFRVYSEKFPKKIMFYEIFFFFLIFLISAFLFSHKKIYSCC